MTSTVIAHINLRGGVGKTTSTISLATRATQYGLRTCVLDLDSQASTSLAFDCVPEANDPVFYDVWQKPDEYLVDSLSRVEENLSLLPSSLQNGLLDVALANPHSQKRAVSESCRVLREAGYQLVVIDCPPSFGAAVISTICAADIIVIPVGSDPFSFRGLEMTISEIASICETYAIPQPEIRILYTRYDRRERISIESWERLRREHPERTIATPIRTSTSFTRSLAARKNIFTHESAVNAREDYDAYVRQVLGLRKEDLIDERASRVTLVKVAAPKAVEDTAEKFVPEIELPAVEEPVATP